MQIVSLADNFDEMSVQFFGGKKKKKNTISLLSAEYVHNVVHF